MSDTKVVPRQPTEAMIAVTAGTRVSPAHVLCVPPQVVAYLWTAMYDAAPAAPSVDDAKAAMYREAVLALRECVEDILASQPTTDVERQLQRGAISSFTETANIIDHLLSDRDELRAEVARLQQEEIEDGEQLRVATAANVALRSALQSAREALARSTVALDDWLVTYADDMADPSTVRCAQERISERGTLAYIADVQEHNRTTLAAIDEALGDKNG